MTTNDPEERFKEIERRLARIEQELKLVETAPEPVAEAPVMQSQAPASVTGDWLQAAILSKRQAQAEQEHVPAPAAVIPIAEAAAPVAPQVDVIPPPLLPVGTPPPIPLPRPAIAPLQYDAKPKAKKTGLQQNAWEQLIGLKLAGWVGAIVLVIGAGFGIKFAYDQGWLGGVSPTIRLALMYLGGFVLIGAGEYVYRKVNAIASAGIFGAGVATFFLVSYAGHAYYGLYQQQTAFMLMALSTLLGAAVAMRGRLVSIAALSLIGGYLAPLVLKGDQSLVVPFLSYLLMLQIVALVLSWWGATTKWWTLRGLSLAATALWSAKMLWTAQPWDATTWFALIYAFLYQTELVLSARRAGQAVKPGAGISFSVLVTAGATAAVLWVFRNSASALRGEWMVALSAITLSAGLVLRQKSASQPIRLLAYGFRFQSALLLLLAVPVAMHGYAICLGWGAMSVALAFIGAKLDDRPTRFTAVAAWGLSLAYLLYSAINDPADAPIRHIWLTVFAQPIPAWAILAGLLSVAGQIIAWLSSSGRADETTHRSEPAGISVAASVVFAIAAIAALPPLGATGVLLVYAWLAFGADIPLPKLAFAPQAAAALALVTVKWAVVDTLAARLAPDWSATQYHPIFNPQMLTGIAIAGSIVAMYRLRRSAINTMLARLLLQGASAAVTVLTIVSLLMTFGLSLEVDRIVERAGQLAWPMMQVKLMAWTVLWTAALLIYLLFGTRLNPAPSFRRTWRTLAWTSVAFLAIKFVIVDTLFWWINGPAPHVASILNLQTIAALAITVGIVAINFILGSGAGAHDTAEESDQMLRIWLAAIGIVLWTGTFEIDRMVLSGAFPGTAIWPSWQLRNLAWTAWWTIGVTGFLAFVHRRDETAMRRLAMLRALAFAPVLLAAKYLLIDTLMFRLMKGPVNVIVLANAQAFAGAILFGALILIREFLNGIAKSQIRVMAGALAVVLLLWIGTFEIDRAFSWSAAVKSMFADAALGEQLALSIFFSLFAIGSVAAGFKMRIAGLRDSGLALFALTLVKVGVIDLRETTMGYRILSFMGLGALLLFTSVLYGKLTPMLLREQGAIANDPQP